MSTSERADTRQALVWLALLTVAFVLTVALSTPWDWLPGAQLGRVDPTAGLPPEQIDRIAAYREQVVPVGLLGALASLVLAVFLGLTRRGARLVRRLPGARWWWLQVVVAVIVLQLLGRVVSLTSAIRAEQVRHEFGLSTQGWWGWGADQLTAYAVGVVTISLLALLVVGLWRRVRRWWFPASLFAAALVVAGSFLYPLVVEPLFAHFTPMPDGAVRSSLLALADRDGVAVDEVLVADASARTTSLNAYVSGFGATKRIVVYDTLLTRATPTEIRLVVAHELGHAENGDVLSGTLMGALGAAAGVTLLALIVKSPRTRRTAGYGGPRDAAVVPAVLALVALGSFFALPVHNVVSRAVEARADLHALELTADPGTFAAAQRRLALANLSTPDPPGLLYVWYASHPTVSQRLALAAAWSAAREPG
ncbi:MAG: M48 family metallopeptidase [Nocardioidaceae bacterium]|nr:M48 family metallopeptidase [Nocardioidaceae bacterium]